MAIILKSGLLGAAAVAVVAAATPAAAAPGKHGPRAERARAVEDLERRGSPHAARRQARDRAGERDARQTPDRPTRNIETRATEARTASSPHRVVVTTRPSAPVVIERRRETHADAPASGPGRDDRQNWHIVRPGGNSDRRTADARQGGGQRRTDNGNDRRSGGGHAGDRNGHGRDAWRSGNGGDRHDRDGNWQGERHGDWHGDEAGGRRRGDWIRWRDSHLRNRARVIVLPSIHYVYRPYWWGRTPFSYDARYFDNGYDYWSAYRPGYGYYGAQYGSGWARLYPWLREDPAGRHWVLWMFDDNRDGRLGTDEALRANSEFARLADRNRDGYLSDREIDEGVGELRDEYRYSFRDD